MTRKTDTIASMEEIEADVSRLQVEYEKSVVDTCIVKSRYVIEALQEAGFCDEHIGPMADTIMTASILQQQFDVLLDLKEHMENISNSLAERNKL